MVENKSFRGNLREDSKLAKIYFLLLIKSRTMSEVSRILYGKVQLSSIMRFFEKLEKIGFIEQYFGNEDDNDLRKNYYKASFEPIIEFANYVAEERQKSSPKKWKRGLEESEKQVLRSLLNSNWFSSTFLSENYFKTQSYPEVCGINGSYTSANPWRFFALCLEELFAIRESLEELIIDLPKYEYSVKLDFEGYVQSNKKYITPKIKKDINKTLKHAKEYLGNYKITNKKLNLYMDGDYILFIPHKLASKLWAMGRVPLTVHNAFVDAVGVRKRY